MRVVHVVILVDNSSQAAQCEKLLKEDGIDVRLIPTPRHLSSNCGTSVRIREKDWLRARQILQENEAPYKQIVPLTRYC